MKYADLTNEHGLTFFKADKVVFGVLWGISGAILVFTQRDAANLILAMVLAFLIRMRIDYANHALAVTIILIAFAWKGELEMSLFAIFFALFTLFGSIRDYFGNIRHQRDLWYKINEPALYYVIPPIIYSTVTSNWSVALVLITYIIAYDFIKFLYKDF